ncbi:hypothetical protein AGABI1DRAFT_101621 [Agaricus bisporus var. burnettii JB137-S8]|uniref:EXPERA domain-containing protein n=1 Tax=Agaricus bisporus var. burnettii (strain JB137-S8 / ATCC MYA-4627 / FGSC 10392) TaxID=597362 RepID=K5WQI3_AGABU|nr:hypothetical protein AGABI2DRAFT_145957 [Agaricus bisporus var. bisporus H97]XP_007331838.1 uncharacterized protein AGABI1DRAFT_101621 [Agaricus bisporus var. burnettii JB137-S8]EKM77576.1 hypothetical protein AGABI1DRAFT_101621 [Agaricus bisporus var. burnettii JB137-S8]EKV42991.1 hypothetical protein AGABI2DRAFT_145957 [Agaricus bisporus var. bisporus H97]
MAVKTRWWISAWFILSAPVVLWDAGYCFMRPRSMKGGDLHWIWRPYELYQVVYGLPGLEQNNGFTNAQSFMNVVETILNLVYIYLAHGVQSPSAPVVGLSAVVMTLAKTVLYWLNDYYCGFCNIGHNDVFTLITLWIIPNGIWLVIPSIITWVLGNDIAEQLNIASKVATGKATKTQKTK